MLGKQFFRFIHTTRSCWAATDKSLLSQLRKKTGYTFANCKKALDLHGNDVNKAEEWLRAQAQSLGWSKATKLEGRSTTQGLIGVCIERSHAAIIEVNCETDFVARNQNFQAMVEAAATACVHFAKTSIRSNGPLTKIDIDAETLKSLPHADGKSLADHMALMIGTVGENASIRRAFCYKAESKINLAGYAHPAQKTTNNTYLGKYGAVVALRSKKDCEIIGKHLCQHIVGMNPTSIGIDGKDEPAKNADDETFLIYQEYLLDPTTPVNIILAENAVEVIDFKRYECGENLDVKPEVQQMQDVKISNQ